MDEDDKLRKLAIESPRLHGLYTTTLGLLILGVFTFFPLHQSLKGGRFVSWYSGVATIWGVVCVIFGLTAIIGGKKAFKLMNPPPGQSKVLVMTIAIIVFGIGIACAIVGSEIIQPVFFKGLKGFSGTR